MEKLIYMDNAATTSTSPEVVSAMLPFFTEYYGNPSSVYNFAQKSKMAIEDAREIIADSIGAAKSNEIYFTGGGSESDNWALKSAAFGLRDKGNHIITTKIEHHAILNTCAYLEKHGFEVTYLDVDSDGFVSLEDVENAITDKTILISVMFANNEIGTIEPVREIGEIAHKHGILFHTDAVQAMCHVPINVTEMNIDLLSASAHKFHGPKGVGFMYMKNSAKLEPFIHGGAQERARRAGTSNVPGIVGMGQAVKLALSTLDKETQTIIDMRNYIVIRILGEIPDVTFDGPGIDSLNRLPSNMHFCFKDVSGDSLLIMLDMNGICASSGSACAAGSIDPSHVLLAIGRSSDEAKGALRLSIDKDLTKEDADYAVDSLKSAVARLRG
ncbi:MAG: IscS subfamily cysteine desulfurase [Eubacteriales bacterium]|nr:IscS subfamily cysteine desulfurase [Eubacteriales bacterium]